MKEFCALRAKAYAYITEDGSVHKRAKGTKKCIIKREIMFEHYEDCLFNIKTIKKSQQRFRSNHHNVHTEEVNKIALSSNYDKDYRHLKELLHIHTERMHLKCVRMKC